MTSKIEGDDIRNEIRSYYRLIYLVVGLFLMLSCRPTPPDCKSYFDLPTYEKRMEAVRTYSIEKNFSLLRCRNYIEALDDQPRTPIIEGGEKSVPFLLVQLNENVDEWQKETAIYLLSVIDQDDKVSNRPDVIANIEKIVSEMKKEQAKSSSTKWLQEMKDRRK